jgi:hypothetical protein
MPIKIEIVQDHLLKNAKYQNEARDEHDRRALNVERIALEKLLGEVSVSGAISSLNADVLMIRTMSTSFLAGSMEEDAACWLRSRANVYEINP